MFGIKGKRHDRILHTSSLVVFMLVHTCLHIATECDTIKRSYMYVYNNSMYFRGNTIIQRIERLLLTPVQRDNVLQSRLVESQKRCLLHYIRFVFSDSRQHHRTHSAPQTTQYRRDSGRASDGSAKYSRDEKKR